MIILERDNKIENLNFLWIGSNAQYKDIKEIISKIGPEQQTEQGLSQEEIQDEWKRLAGTISGLR